MFPKTHPYLSTRLQLVKALVKVQNKEAIEAGLHHARAIQDLSHYDKIAVGKWIPALMLETARDQECYDFVKWWHFAEQDCHNDAHPPTPFLTFKNHDVFEKVVFKQLSRTTIIPHATHMAALALIKTRVLVDLRKIKAGISSGFAKSEVFDMCRGDFVSSITLARRTRIQKIINNEELAAYILKLKGQLRELYELITERKRVFFSDLIGVHALCPSRLNQAAACCTNCAELEELDQQSYRAWIETPGAMEVSAELWLEEDLKEAEN